MKALADAAFFAVMLAGVIWLVIWSVSAPRRGGKPRWSPFDMRDGARDHGAMPTKRPPRTVTRRRSGRSFVP